MLWCHSHLVWLVFEASNPTCACFHFRKNFCDFFYIQATLLSNLPPAFILSHAKPLRCTLYEALCVCAEGITAVQGGILPTTVSRNGGQ